MTTRGVMLGTMNAMNPLKIIKAAADFHRTRREWLGGDGEPVPLEQAQKRADVCLKCPNNQEKPIYEIFAGAVAHGVIQQLKTKDAMGLRVRQEECLHVCSACLCVLKLKVHVPLKFIPESPDDSMLHPDCWILFERKTQPKNSNDNESDGLPK